VTLSDPSKCNLKLQESSADYQRAAPFVTRRDNCYRQRPARNISREQFRSNSRDSETDQQRDRSLLDRYSAMPPLEPSRACTISGDSRNACTVAESRIPLLLGTAGGRASSERKRFNRSSGQARQLKLPARPSLLRRREAMKREWTWMMPGDV